MAESVNHHQQNEIGVCNCWVDDLLPGQRENIDGTGTARGCRHFEIVHLIFSVGRVVDEFVQ